MQRATRLYLAGPMRGVPGFNFTAFDIYANELREKGFEVFNPAEKDREKWPDIDFTQGDKAELPDRFINQALAMDLDFILHHADAVAVLPGWRMSRGANLEVAAANILKIPVIRCYDLKYIFIDGREAPENGDVISAFTADSTPLSAKSALPKENEIRIINTITGGAKGQKIERYDLIPEMPLRELARAYGVGAKKYSDDNWRNGYSWRLSFAAMMRHAWAFWRGEEMDEETGCKHLAQAAWHCFALLWFSENKKQLDDRPDAKQD